jgi:spoIIIJ-associated protein
MNKDEITNLIKELIEKTTLPVRDISISDNEKEGKDKTVWFHVEMDHPHFFINRDGEALLALNHLVRRIIESKTQNDGIFQDSSILIDINGFQKKRVDNIKAVAHMMAERARYFKSNIEIDPMSAFDRRIVHEFLSDAIDLKTESEGAGPTRRVVIKYVGNI